MNSSSCPDTHSLFAFQEDSSLVGGGGWDVTPVCAHRCSPVLNVGSLLVHSPAHHWTLVWLQCRKNIPTQPPVLWKKSVARIPRTVNVCSVLLITEKHWPCVSCVPFAAVVVDPPTLKRLSILSPSLHCFWKPLLGKTPQRLWLVSTSANVIRSF